MADIFRFFFCWTACCELNNSGVCFFRCAFLTTLWVFLCFNGVYNLHICYAYRKGIKTLFLVHFCCTLYFYSILWLVNKIINISFAAGWFLLFLLHLPLSNNALQDNEQMEIVLKASNNVLNVVLFFSVDGSNLVLALPFILIKTVCLTSQPFVRHGSRNTSCCTLLAVFVT